MVGGKIVGLSFLPDRLIRVHVHDAIAKDTCCVKTDAKILNMDGKVAPIDIGDSIWWQNGRLYWTPKQNIGKKDLKCGRDFDIPMRKIGYSH